MFDIAPSELLLCAIVALVVIGPKDLPRALRTLGQWMGRARAMSRHFRAGVDTMLREAELEEMKKKWAEENARIMAEHPWVEGSHDQPELSDGQIPQTDINAASAKNSSGSAAVQATDMADFEKNDSEGDMPSPDFLPEPIRASGRSSATLQFSGEIEKNGAASGEHLTGEEAKVQKPPASDGEAR